MAADWRPDLDGTRRKEISDLIAEHGLDNLMQGLPREEVEIFETDLRALKFLKAG